MKQKQLKIWNGRGCGDYHGGIFFVAAYTKKQAAEMMAKAGHPHIADRPEELPFFANRMIREMNVYFSEGHWGNSMTGITPELGLWATMSYGEKPVRVI